MSQNNQPTLLVTGASGQLGHRVVELLLEADAGAIVATTRTPDKLTNFAEQGVIIRHADFNQPDSLTEAFAGVDRLLIISTDSLEKPGLRVKQHRAAIKAAEAAGVSHVVYTSVANPGPESVIPDHYETEEALANSQLNWTILRNNLYADLLPSSLGQAIQMGQYFSAAGDGRLAYISREDCAQAAAAALLSSFDGRRTLNITGPEALSPADLAALASDIADKPVTYVPLTKDALIKNMVAAGVPEPVAQFVGALDAATARGQFDVLSDDFAELTGHAPTAVSEFLTANRDALLS